MQGCCVTGEKKRQLGQRAVLHRGRDGGEMGAGEDYDGVYHSREETIQRRKGWIDITIADGIEL